MSHDHIENLEELQQLLTVDGFEACSYEAIRARIQRLGSMQQAFLERCERTLAESNEVREVEFRKPLIDILIATLPESEDAIHRCLIRSAGGLDSEVHFTFFCFLDNVPHLSEGAQSSSRILGFVTEYLMNVRTNRGHAAWMAGDLLGDHWALDESFPILERLSREARFVAGREGAIDGLTQAVGREEKRKEAVVRLLTEIAGDDRSESVRHTAKTALWRLEGRDMNALRKEILEG